MPERLREIKVNLASLFLSIVVTCGSIIGVWTSLNKDVQGNAIVLQQEVSLRKNHYALIKANENALRAIEREQVITDTKIQMYSDNMKQMQENQRKLTETVNMLYSSVSVLQNQVQNASKELEHTVKK